ncbi:hypothetical protein K6119_14620 [Paracrocinitomix mangrovi]|uniref:hypothetical protein n=1 Tax=Paracrocinitomix mangrovi TaxID=2862509 RepID=UPI001C8E7B64|nr:hypothetical protein [Paracrocinitomix mangrovi]UKN00966.1 hypothetical protein K6119_14620 [Paracrocinitomix mangrovi]
MKLTALTSSILVINFVLLTSCGASSEDDNSGEEKDSVKVELSFEEGGAKTAEEFFKGINAQVEATDFWLNNVQEYDLQDVSEDSIISALDTLIINIDSGRNTLAKYENAEWEKQSEFYEITMNWYNTLSEITNDYYYKMAEPMSRPDNSWNAEEQAFYDEYVSAYNNFFEIDKQWLIMKDDFAAANIFKVSSEVPELP